MNFNPYPYGESTENYEKYDTYQKSCREPRRFHQQTYMENM